MKVSVDATGEAYYTREIDPDDSWDIGTQALTEISAVAYLDEKYGEEVEVGPNNTVCVLVEHYSDGCTFGSSEYVDTKRAFTTEAQAEAYVQDLPTPNHGYFGSHIGWLYFTVQVQRSRY